jgi:hypothetical protein
MSLPLNLADRDECQPVEPDRGAHIVPERHARLRALIVAGFILEGPLPERRRRVDHIDLDRLVVDGVQGGTKRCDHRTQVDTNRGHQAEHEFRSVWS